MATFWRTSCAPLDQADVENCQRLEQERMGDHFTIKIRVTHQPGISHPAIHPSLIPFDGYTHETERTLSPQPSHALTGPVLSSYMQLYLLDPFISPYLIQAMTSDVIREANRILVQGCLPDSYYDSPNFRLFKLVLDVTVLMLYDDDDMIDMITRDQSMGASKIAIESLKKVKVEEGAAMGSCSICLTELCDGTTMEALSMPCKHVYHQDCLLQWLKTSHTCPLCRYTLPTSTD